MSNFKQKHHTDHQVHYIFSSLDEVGRCFVNKQKTNHISPSDHEHGALLGNSL